MEIIKTQEEQLKIEEIQRERDAALEMVEQLKKEKEDLIEHNHKLFLRQATSFAVEEKKEEEKEEKINPEELKGIWRI